MATEVVARAETKAARHRRKVRKVAMDALKGKLPLGMQNMAKICNATGRIYVSNVLVDQMGRDAGVPKWDNAELEKLGYKDLNEQTLVQEVQENLGL